MYQLKISGDTVPKDNVYFKDIVFDKRYNWGGVATFDPFVMPYDRKRHYIDNYEIKQCAVFRRKGDIRCIGICVFCHDELRWYYFGDSNYEFCDDPDINGHAVMLNDKRTPQVKGAIPSAVGLNLEEEYYSVEDLMTLLKGYFKDTPGGGKITLVSYLTYRYCLAIPGLVLLRYLKSTYVIDIFDGLIAYLEKYESDYRHIDTLNIDQL